LSICNLSFCRFCFACFKTDTSTMMLPVLSDKTSKFCRTISVRGIPRIVKSKSTGHCVIWLLAVLTCSAILIWQLVVIFNRYLSYPVNTVFIQSLYEESATFPDVTICNLKQPRPTSQNSNNVLPNTTSIINATVSSKTFYNYMVKHYPTLEYRMISDIVQYIITFQQDPYSILLDSVIQSNFSFSRADSPIIFIQYTNWDYIPNINTGWADVYQLLDTSTRFATQWEQIVPSVKIFNYCLLSFTSTLLWTIAWCTTSQISGIHKQQAFVYWYTLPVLHLTWV